MTDKFDSIGFDLDGTLWDGTGAIEKAWLSVLPNRAEIERIPSSEEIKGVMGLPMPAIVKKLFPYLDSQQSHELMEVCKSAEQSYIRANGGKLFEGLENVLKELISMGYKLYIVSNCQDGYIAAFLEHYGFEKYFSDYECIGHTGKSKGKNIKAVIERNRFKKSIYIGDTQGDCDGATEAGVPFIFAEYGFGNPMKYFDKLERITDLTAKAYIKL